MFITLSDNQVVEILAINISGGTFDWKRTEGYAGACVSPVTIESLETAEAAMKAVLEAELIQS